MLKKLWCGVRGRWLVSASELIIKVHWPPCKIFVCVTKSVYPNQSTGKSLANFRGQCERKLTDLSVECITLYRPNVFGTGLV